MRQQIRKEYYILLTPTMALMFYNFNSREEQSKGSVNRSKKCAQIFTPQVLRDFTQT